MTIYDIAEACGVSIATVSRVLNNSDKVSAKTREKVLRVMKQQDYSPNPFARGLGLDSMKMIGLLCTDVSDSFYAKAVSLTEHELKKRNLDTMLVCTGDDAGAKKKYIQFMLKKHVDAIILIGSPFHEEHDTTNLAEAAQNVPIIAINSLIDKPNVYSVLCDEASGIAQAVKELVRHDAKNILYLYDQLSYSGQQKLRGYKEGLQATGIVPNAKLIRQVPRDLAAVKTIVGRLIAQNSLEPSNDLSFSAVIASEDIIAIGAQKALAAAGLSMPVIGCNNSVLAECATPSLTSLDNRLDVLCPAAVDVLTQLLDGSKATPSQTVFPAILEHRESFPA